MLLVAPGITTRTNKKLLVTRALLLVTRAVLLVTRALLLGAMKLWDLLDSLLLRVNYFHSPQVLWTQKKALSVSFVHIFFLRGKLQRRAGQVSAFFAAIGVPMGLVVGLTNQSSEPLSIWSDAE